MTTTINASVSSSGLVTTADGSGIVKLQSNGVTTNSIGWGRSSWNGTTFSVNASYNTSSITRSAAGNYTISFSVTQTDINYSVSSGGGYTTSYTGWQSSEDTRLGTRTSSLFYLAYITPNGTAYADPGNMSYIVVGN
jgi:hypothetical protein